MLRMFKLLPLAILALLVAFTVSCEGPAGADGADGANGADGADGANGADGADANAFCVDCHSQENWDSIEGLFALSGHSAGNYVGYAGGRGSCARCHSSEGFADYLAGYGGENIAYPSAWNCETCHGNHTTLEEDNISAPLVTMAAVTAIEDGTVLDFDGPANLCANCHQSRRGYAYYVAIDSIDTDDDDINDYEIAADSVYINSSHAGPHHGPQAQVLLGLGGYGTGSTAAHSALACVSCHMGEATETAGGHSFIPNLANCTVACHSSVTDMATWLADKQATFSTRLEALAVKLVAEGALSGDATDGYHPHVGVVSDDAFKAFWNYMYLYEDHSKGVHNPGYSTTLFATAEAAVN